MLRDESENGQQINQWELNQRSLYHKSNHLTVYAITPNVYNDVPSTHGSAILEKREKTAQNVDNN